MIHIVPQNYVQINILNIYLANLEKKTLYTFIVDHIVGGWKTVKIYLCIKKIE